jgi:predicted SnoaL-like aldol condensation-catalyzing enzyme
VARGLFASWSFSAQRGFMLLGVVASGIAILSSAAPAQSQSRPVMAADTLGANAREALIDIFRMKDTTAVDRYFAESFIQHDPGLADGLAGMKSFAAEVASSPTSDTTIYRTLVDGDFVLLHSRYQGVARHAGSAIAFDLFRFKDGKIVEHWGGQEPEDPPNLSGRTQAARFENWRWNRAVEVLAPVPQANWWIFHRDRCLQRPVAIIDFEALHDVELVGVGRSVETSSLSEIAAVGSRASLRID